MKIFDKWIFALCLNFALTVLSSCYAQSDDKAYETKLAAHIVQSIKNAHDHKSKLNADVLNIGGMSSKKVRHFLNNLCSLPGARYLEIGTWAGSTWISALYGNENALADAVAIDNWSEWGGPKKEFMKNCQTFLSKSKYRYYEVDCFTINKRLAFSFPINIYFYDANHTEQSQELALTYFDDIFDDVFILVVDDWNHSPTKAGTIQGIRKLNYKVLLSIELPARSNGDQEWWWNGLYVALLKKAK